MKPLRAVWVIFTLGLFAWGFHEAMSVPADAMQGNVQRIFYYHLPSWMAMSLCFAVNLGASIAFLALRRSRPAIAQKADALAVATAEMGVVFCLVGLVTGSLWARYAWGIWWTWDERLTSTLILWLIYLSYLLLRRFAAGPQMQTLAAVLAIFGYLDVPIVYMSTRWWRTQHPGPVIGGDPNAGLDPSMAPALWWNAAAWIAWAVLIVGIRYAAERGHQAQQEAAAQRALNLPDEVIG